MKYIFKKIKLKIHLIIISKIQTLIMKIKFKIQKMETEKIQ